MTTPQVEHLMNAIRDAINAARPGIRDLWDEIRDAAVEEVAPIGKAGWNKANWEVGKILQWAIWLAAVAILAILNVHQCTHSLFWTSLTAVTLFVGVPLWFLTWYRYPLLLLLVKRLPEKWQSSIGTYIAGLLVLAAIVCVIPIWKDPEKLLLAVIFFVATVAAHAKGWKSLANLGTGATVVLLLYLLFADTAIARKFEGLAEGQMSEPTATHAPPTPTRFVVEASEGEWTLPSGIGKVTLVIPQGTGYTHWILRAPLAKKYTVTPTSDILVQREWQETQHMMGNPYYVHHMESWRTVPLIGLPEVGWAPITKVRFQRNPYAAVEVVVDTGL